MSSIRIVVRHGESVSRPEQPELWVQGEKIPSGVEKGFDLVVGEPFNIEAKLTEDQTKAAKDVEEADKKIDEERRSGKKNQPSEVAAKSSEPPRQGFAASPAPKTESPPKQTESRSGIDSKEVKSEAPLKK